MNRRHFLQSLAAASLPLRSAGGPADYTLRIGSADVAVAPRRTIKTTGYNGAVPGPVLRMSEGSPVSIDVYNDTSVPELVHFHGLFIPPEVDGAMEEGTPMLAPHTSRRIEFTPRPSGTRWYHTHVPAYRNLHRGTYTGQFGFLVVEPKSDPARYDQEVFLALHGWEPFLAPMPHPAEGDDNSLEIHYGSFSVNGHALGLGDPIRVQPDRRVLFRILNASASLFHRLALPGHRFTVVALDGNPVPRPRAVSVLELGPGERIDAIVETGQPGVWVLGDLDPDVRRAGLGIVVEYAGRSGEPQWQDPPSEPWDYTAFGAAQLNEEVRETTAERVPLVFQSTGGNRAVERWTINGKQFPKTDPILVRAGRRYRLVFDNRSDDDHPVHLHRHSFELTKIAGKPTAGLMKDVVAVPARKQVEVDLVAANPGPSLFHCHMQLHMDYGFMTLLQYEKGD
jgi:FtsP/CotA-like multicopper oxidase with cupredoxin domain